MVNAMDVMVVGVSKEGQSCKGLKTSKRLASLSIAHVTDRSAYCTYLLFCPTAAGACV